MYSKVAYEAFFNVWFGGEWECVKCGGEEWKVNDVADAHTCVACGHAESLERIPQLASEQDAQGHIDFAHVMRVYDEGTRHQHYGSRKWFTQLALIHAGVLYGRVPVPPTEIFLNSNAAREYLLLKLYPDGMRCPECNGKKPSYCIYENRYQCCGKKFSVYKHTPLHRTKLGAEVWLRVLWALKNGTDPKDTQWLGELMYGDHYKKEDAPTVRIIANKLAYDEQFSDMVGNEFEQQVRRPQWVKRYLQAKQGDPYEAVQLHP